MTAEKLNQKQQLTGRMIECCKILKNMTSVACIILIRQVHFLSVQASKTFYFSWRPLPQENKIRTAGYSEPCK